VVHKVAAQATVTQDTQDLLSADKIRGVPKSLIEEFCFPRQGSLFDEVILYSKQDVYETFGLTPISIGSKYNPTAAHALSKWSATAIRPSLVLENCTVEWVDWISSNAKNRKPIIRKEYGARIAISGDMATISLRGGRVVRKSLASNGFRYNQAGPTPRQLSLFSDG
jgi:hypothetical protein